MQPMLQKMLERIYNWIIVFGPKILVAILVLIIGEIIIKFLNKWIRNILSSKRLHLSLRPFFEHLIHFILQALLIFSIMQILGIQMTIFAAVIGAFGVAAGFALSGTLQNFASGVLIILMRPFIIGDNITTQGEEGTVMDIRLFYTVVLTFNNTTLIVPNSKLSNEVIFNLTREEKRRMDISLKFNYNIEFENIRSVCLNAIESFEHCLKNPAPRIGIDKLETDGYTVIINAWTKSHGFQDVRLQFNEKLMNDLKQMFIDDKKDEKDSGIQKVQPKVKDAISDSDGDGKNKKGA